MGGAPVPGYEPGEHPPQRRSDEEAERAHRAAQRAKAAKTPAQAADEDIASYHRHGIGPPLVASRHAPGPPWRRQRSGPRATAGARP
eukprot:7073723-Alexandrium_andersonii.AAC.1